MVCAMSSPPRLVSTTHREYGNNYPGCWVSAEAALAVLELAKKAWRCRGWLHPDVVREYVAPFFQAAPREVPLVIGPSHRCGMWALDVHSKHVDWVMVGEHPKQTGGTRFSSCTAVGTGRLILVAGGMQNPSSPTAEAWVLDDPGTGRPGRVASPMNVGRWGHAAAEFRGGVLVAGGHTAEGATSSCELWDSSSGTWSLLPPLRRARAFGRACMVSGGIVVVAGGKDESSRLIRDVEALRPGASAWEVIATLEFPRCFPAVSRGLVEGEIGAIVAGGLIRHRGSAAVDGVVLPQWLRDGLPSPPYWQPPRAFQLPLMPTPVWGCASAEMKHGHVLFGGDPSDAPMAPFVWVYDHRRKRRWGHVWKVDGPVPHFPGMPRSGMAATRAAVLPRHWVWKGGELVGRGSTEPTF
eukprot:Hpha_TRINITY_DN16425_c0_g7::TRINITY_DN16425_c0_g7_i1::g.159477::m.159477